MELRTPIALQWINNKPLWIEQWPLSKEILEALIELVQSQLEKYHIEASTSQWNLPVFVIKNQENGECSLIFELLMI